MAALKQTARTIYDGTLPRGVMFHAEGPAWDVRSGFLLARAVGNARWEAPSS